MTNEQYFSKMEQEYGNLSNEAKETMMQIGNRNMPLEELINEAKKAYSKLNDKQKSNIHVDNTGLMVTTGNPEEALSATVCAYGITCGKK